MYTVVLIWSKIGLSAKSNKLMQKALRKNPPKTLKSKKRLNWVSVNRGGRGGHPVQILNGPKAPATIVMSIKFVLRFPFCVIFG